MGVPCIDCPSVLLPRWWIPIELSGYSVRFEGNRVERAPGSLSDPMVPDSASFVANTMTIHANLIEIDQKYLLTFASAPDSFAAQDHICRVLLASGCSRPPRKVFDHMCLLKCEDANQAMTEFTSNLSPGFESAASADSTRAPDFAGMIGSKAEGIEVFRGMAIHPVTEEKICYIAFRYPRRFRFNGKSSNAIKILESRINTFDGLISILHHGNR